MAKGGYRKNAGRIKGSPNKVTSDAKQLLTAAINGQSAYFDETMEIIRKKNPVEWAKIMTSLFKFVLPTKTDITTDGKAFKQVKAISITLPGGEKLEI